jgi:hypothetical protein
VPQPTSWQHMAYERPQLDIYMAQWSIVLTAVAYMLVFESGGQPGYVA